MKNILIKLFLYSVTVLLISKIYQWAVMQGASKDGSLMIAILVMISIMDVIRDYFPKEKQRG